MAFLTLKPRRGRWVLYLGDEEAAEYADDRRGLAGLNAARDALPMLAACLAKAPGSKPQAA